MQNRNFACQLRHEIHVMFDDDNAVSLAKTQDQFACAFGFRVCQACNWLVQKNQFRILHQKHADFEPLFLPM